VVTMVGLAIIVSRKAAVPVVTQSEAVKSAALDPNDGNIRALARDVFSDHVLAFELTSALLVIAVVATVLLARKPKRGDLVIIETSGVAK